MESYGCTMASLCTDFKDIFYPLIRFSCLPPAVGVNGAQGPCVNTAPGTNRQPRV